MRTPSKNTKWTPNTKNKINRPPPVSKLDNNPKYPPPNSNNSQSTIHTVRACNNLIRKINQTKRIKSLIAVAVMLVNK